MAFRSQAPLFPEEMAENTDDRMHHPERSIIVAGIMGEPVREGNFKERNFRETEALIRDAAKAGARPFVRVMR